MSAALERIEGQRYSRVLPVWTDFPVVIIGGGPSLTSDQVEMVRERRAADAVRCIGVNDAFMIAPFIDISYYADAKFGVWMAQGIAKPKLGLTAAQVRERWAAFAGQKCGIESAQPYHPDDVHVLRIANQRTGLSLDAGAIATGRSDGYAGHSGFQALNIATLAGGKTHLLLGFDGRPSAEGKDNWHGAHPLPTPPAVWDYIRRSFSCVENDLKAAGIRVLNCSPNSAIDTFEKEDLQNALELFENYSVTAQA